MGLGRGLFGKASPAVTNDGYKRCMGFCTDVFSRQPTPPAMLCLSVLTFAMAALVSAAPPPKKNKNQFTIRPIAQQDLCLDVEPASGESVGYALV